MNKVNAKINKCLLLELYETHVGQWHENTRILPYFFLNGLCNDVPQVRCSGGKFVPYSDFWVRRNKQENVTLNKQTKCSTQEESGQIWKITLYGKETWRLNEVFGELQNMVPKRTETIKGSCILTKSLNV